MQTTVLSAEAPEALRQAVAVLQRGGLVAFPTDTVYGVGALAFAAEAVQRLYEVKGRSADKAIAVLVAREADLTQVPATLTPSPRHTMSAFRSAACAMSGRNASTFSREVFAPRGGSVRGVRAGRRPARRAPRGGPTG